MTEGVAGAVRSPSRLRLGLVVALAVLVLDQATKWWILEQVMDPPRVVEVTSFFNLVLVHNYGVSFGMFADRADLTRWLLIAVALAIVAMLGNWLRRAERTLVAVGCGLVIGGAIGNVIDRLRVGAVIDFLDFHLAGWHWPAFNVADGAIVVGVGLLILDGLYDRRHPT